MEVSNTFSMTMPELLPLSKHLKKFEGLFWTIMEYLPSSPELPPCDYYMFGHLEEEFGRHRFDNDTDMETCVCIWNPLPFLGNGGKKNYLSTEKDMLWSYVEKGGIIIFVFNNKFLLCLVHLGNNDYKNEDDISRDKKFITHFVCFDMVKNREKIITSYFLLSKNIQIWMEHAK